VSHHHWHGGFSADGRQVVTASDDKTARVWDLSGPSPVATVLAGHTGSVYTASFSADGRRVVTASADKTARVWDLSAPNPVAIVLVGHTGPVYIASFSADGRRVVTASEDKTARVWDLSGPSPVATVLEGHTFGVHVASFSMDGRRVVTASSDGTTRVWDLSGPRPVATVLEGKANSRNAKSFSADRNSRKNSLAATQDFLSGKSSISNSVNAAAFSTDGRRIVTGSYDNTARVWETYPNINELSALVVAHLGRCLSTAQRERFGLAIENTVLSRNVIPASDAQGRCRE
jgi:WD40 repeat protein